VPFDDAYGDAFDKSQMGLVHVPRVSVYRGFVFANLDPDAMSLEEYLGSARAYLDYVAELDPAGVAFTAGRQQYEFRANWKFQMENTIDIYHVSFTHKSWLDILSARAGKRVPFVQNMTKNEAWRTLGFPNGHAVHEYRPLVEAVEAQDGGHNVGIGELLPFNFVIFPNLGFVGAQLRVINPVAVDQTRVELYPIVLPSDQEATVQALRDHEAFYGPAGAGSSDDMEVAFDRVTEGLQATATPQDWVLIARGVQREELREDGVRVGRSTDELPQRAFYGRWRELIDAGAPRAEETGR
jgi:phenylpropionate dioxygenase-like ring-hydroxylating dioxygenase large terminal subunit